MGRWPSTSPVMTKSAPLSAMYSFAFLQEEDAAVDAGVHPLAVAVLRVPDDLQVFHPLVHHLDGDVELVGDPDRLGFTAGVLAGAGAEGRGEVEGLDRYPLVKHHLDRKGGVEPAGEKGEGFSLHCVSWGAMPDVG